MRRDNIAFSPSFSYAYDLSDNPDVEAAAAMGVADIAMTLFRLRRLGLAKPGLIAADSISAFLATAASQSANRVSPYRQEETCVRGEMPTAEEDL